MLMDFLTYGGYLTVLFAVLRALLLIVNRMFGIWDKATGRWIQLGILTDLKTKILQSKDSNLKFEHCFYIVGSEKNMVLSLSKIISLFSVIPHLESQSESSLVLIFPTSLEDLPVNSTLRLVSQISLLNTLTDSLDVYIPVSDLAFANLLNRKGIKHFKLLVTKFHHSFSGAVKNDNVS